MQANQDVDREAQLTVYSPVVTVIGQSAYALFALLIWLYWRHVAPPDNVTLWASIALGSFSVSAVLCGVLILRRPDQEEFLRVWRPIDKLLAPIFDLQAVAAIFLLFPHGDTAHRLVALAFCVGYGPLQMSVDPGNTWANRFSVVAILGAFAAQLFIWNDPSRWILTIMFVLYGATLIIAADVFRNAVTEAITRRRKSEEDAVAMRKAYEEVAESRDAKTRFIANASHDLGQPLLAASLLAKQLQGNLSDDARAKAQQRLTDALSLGQAHVSHMLSYLRLEADAVTPNIADVTLDDLLGAAVRSMESRAAEAGALVTVRAPAETIACDAALVQRALSNLINNAIVHGKARNISINAERLAGAYRISVRDDGRGVPSEDRARVFEDYFQGTNSGGGFGLGLSSVARIAKLHSGRAWLDADTSWGTLFHLELPRP